jgi:CRP-like cAMP-binding protein
MNSYLDRINDFLSYLDSDAWAALQSISTTRVFKKGDFLLRQDEVCKRSFLLEEGTARKYYLNDGREITTELYFKEDIAVSLNSYTLQVPSREYIQAITDVSVTVTDHNSFQAIKKQYPKLAELDLMITEYYAVWLEDRLFQLHTMDATERYRLMLTKQPHIIREVPLTYIASYLGISLETLSRIRARI